jgi:hypothetical protein
MVNNTASSFEKRTSETRDAEWPRYSKYEPSCSTWKEEERRKKKEERRKKKEERRKNEILPISKE